MVHLLNVGVGVGGGLLMHFLTTEVFFNHSGSAKRCKYETAPRLLASFLQQNEGFSWGYRPGVCGLGHPGGGAERDGGASNDMNHNIKHGRVDLRKRLVI